MTYETVITKEMEEPVHFNGLYDIFAFLTSNYKARDEEQVILITLGESYRLIKSHIIYIGGITETAIDMRDVMYKALMDKAQYIVMGYIRSSKTELMRPRSEDYANAEKIYKAAKTIGFTVMAQIIVSGNGYTTIRNDQNSSIDMIDD
jgi:DNA repair protein RadC